MMDLKELATLMNQISWGKILLRPQNFQVLGWLVVIGVATNVGSAMRAQWMANALAQQRLRLEMDYNKARENSRFFSGLIQGGH